MVIQLHWLARCEDLSSIFTCDMDHVMSSYESYNVINNMLKGVIHFHLSLYDYGGGEDKIRTFNYYIASNRSREAIKKTIRRYSTLLTVSSRRMRPQIFPLQRN